LNLFFHYLFCSNRDRMAIDHSFYVAVDPLLLEI
jgi:hypothetical protein